VGMITTDTDPEVTEMAILVSCQQQPLGRLNSE
jgi:hypothetical protein